MKCRGPVLRSRRQKLKGRAIDTCLLLHEEPVCETAEGWIQGPPVECPTWEGGRYPFAPYPPCSPAASIHASGMFRPTNGRPSVAG